MVQEDIDQEEVVMAEEGSDEDVVEIIDDDDVEGESTQMEAQDGSSVAMATEMLPTAHITGSVATSVSQQPLGGADFGRPDFLPQIRTERLPSTGRGPGGAFAPGQAPVYDDGDGIVPSTPTLSVPRRNDGFAEAVSSPQVQARFTFGTGAESSSSVPSQLASQGALGMDDTKMDLSQFDESEGRSMPTTPSGHRSPAAQSQETVSAASEEHARATEQVTVVTEEEPVAAESVDAVTEELPDDRPSVEEVSSAVGLEVSTAEAIVEEPEDEQKKSSSTEEAHKAGDEGKLEEFKEETETEAQDSAEKQEAKKQPLPRKPNITPIVWSEPTELSSSAHSTSHIPPLITPQPKATPVYRGRRGRSLLRGSVQPQGQSQVNPQQRVSQHPQSQMYRGVPLLHRDASRGRGGPYRGSGVQRGPFRGGQYRQNF